MQLYSYQFKVPLICGYVVGWSDNENMHFNMEIIYQINVLLLPEANKEECMEFE